MKLVKVLLPLAAVGLIMGTASARDIDGFYGKVEQMPTAENPAWVIGGKTFNLPKKTSHFLDLQRFIHDIQGMTNFIFSGKVIGRRMVSHIVQQESRKLSFALVSKKNRSRLGLGR